MPLHYEANLPRYNTMLELAPQVLETLQAKFVPAVVEYKPSKDPAPEKVILTITLETLEAATGWILICGAAIKVLTPLELKENIHPIGYSDISPLPVLN